MSNYFYLNFASIFFKNFKKYTEKLDNILPSIRSFVFAGENKYISCIVTNSDGKTVTISDALIKDKMPEFALFRE